VGENDGPGEVAIVAGYVVRPLNFDQYGVEGIAPRRGTKQRGYRN